MSVTHTIPVMHCRSCGAIDTPQVALGPGKYVLTVRCVACGEGVKVLPRILLPGRNPGGVLLPDERGQALARRRGCDSDA